jgi:hypothetical protein
MILFYYSRIKKGESQGKNVTLETMMHSKTVGKAHHLAVFFSLLGFNGAHDNTVSHMGRCG